MIFWTKKQAAALGLTAVLALSLSACGKKEPGTAEIEQAIGAGTLTIEDALNKGWVDEAWVETYLETHSVPASDKIEAYRVGDFTTTTITGEEFTQAQVQDVTLFAFVDPETEGALSFFEEMCAAAPAVEEAGAGLLLCVKGTTPTDLFSGAPFPVILLNDSLQNAMGFNSETVEDPDLLNTASWYVSGTFLSSWYASLTREGLAEDARTFVTVAAQMRETSETGGTGDAAAAPMG